MKKVSLLALATALTAAQGASADLGATLTGTCPKAFQGFFVGGNIGYGVGTGTLKHNTKRTFPTRFVEGLYTVNTEGAGHRTRLGVHGVDGGVNTGYTHRFGNWGLGLEFVANWANTSGKHRADSFDNSSTYLISNPSQLVFRDNTVSQVHHRVKLRNSLQLRGNFSYVVCNLWAPKVILGWDNSKWSRSYSETSTNTETLLGVGTTSTSNFLPYSRSHSKRYNAFLWGFGVDFLATKHVIVGFEYTGTTSGRKSTRYTAVENNRGVISTVTRSASWKPQYNKFALTAKVIY